MKSACSVFLELLRMCFTLMKKSIKSRSSPPKVFLEKSVLKKCSKFTGEHSSRSVISIKLLCNFIKTALRDGRSPVNLLHIFRTTFYKNTTGGLLLKINSLFELNKKSNPMI